MASRSTVNLNNYEQQDEEAGEEYAMLPNSSSRTPLNGTRSDGYSPLSGTAAASKKPWGNKRKALIFVGCVKCCYNSHTSKLRTLDCLSYLDSLFTSPTH